MQHPYKSGTTIQYTTIQGFPRSGVMHTPRGAAVKCAQMKILENPFRSQRTLRAHPSQLEIGVLSSSMSVAPHDTQQYNGGSTIGRWVVQYMIHCMVQCMLFS